MREGAFRSPIRNRLLGLRRWLFRLEDRCLEVSRAVWDFPGLFENARFRRAPLENSLFKQGCSAAAHPKTGLLGRKQAVQAQQAVRQANRAVWKFAKQPVQNQNGLNKPD